jgi:hypothetical protein
MPLTCPTCKLKFANRYELAWHAGKAHLRSRGAGLTAELPLRVTARTNVREGWDADRTAT